MSALGFESLWAIYDPLQNQADDSTWSWLQDHGMSTYEHYHGQAWLMVGTSLVWFYFQTV